MSSHWDPLHSPDWDKATLSVCATKRIQKDLAGFHADPPSGIYIYSDESTMHLVDALIIGPEGTPYENGFFLFLVRFPPDYPFAPPRVRIQTTDGGQVRFNPNLYADGKVCLSILGTWSGPVWTAGQSLTTVLLSIQSLMCEKPWYNEPGRGDPPHGTAESDAYNVEIVYQTLRVAICQALEQPNGMPAPLEAVMRARFVENYCNYHVTINQLISRDGLPIVVGNSFNRKGGCYKIEELRGRLKRLWGTASDDPDPLD